MAASGSIFQCLLRTSQQSLGKRAAIQKIIFPRGQPVAASAPGRFTTARLGSKTVVPRRQFTTSSTRRQAAQPGDDPTFTSIVDNPPELVRTGKRHGKGLIILAIIPITALFLGTWQVYRLKWKTDLIAKCEDRIIRDPLPLPPRVDPDAIADFDYRRVYAEGVYRHDQEMLIGPRMRDGEQGFMVVTPLERGDDPSTKVLVNRGWVSKKFADQKSRPDSVKPGEKVRVEGMLREPWKKNMFTPENRPDIGEFYFPDVKQMAELTGSQPVWIEQTIVPDIITVYDYEARGIPIGRVAEVNLRNNHAQYIFTWYGLAAATSIMFWLVVKKPSNSITKRVKMNKGW